jgi:hypothetical protein
MDVRTHLAVVAAVTTDATSSGQDGFVVEIKTGKGTGGNGRRHYN